MKICHISEYCHVSGSAGTERYILELVRGLARREHECAIGWLCGPRSQRGGIIDGVRVIPVASAPSRVDAPDADFRERFTADVLEREAPDLLHFHTFGFSEAVAARAARAAGVPYLFTFHSPAWFCRRGTLIRWGRVPCDGEVRATRCAACKCQERTGGPGWAGYLAAGASGLLGTPIGLVSRGAWRRRTAFWLDTRNFRSAAREFLRHCAIGVACAEWSIPMLCINGLRRDRVVHLPQGVPRGFVEASAANAPREGDSGLFNIGYVGRPTWVKGIHVLLKAFLQANYENARLRIYGWPDDDNGDDYTQSLRRLAGDDPRVVLVPACSFDRMIEAYRSLDLVAIPSLWFETGPMVLLEAAQLGIPVWGSARVGQLGLLRERGRVIEDNSVDGWQRALTEAFNQHRERAWPPVAPDSAGLLTMADVADRMARHYAQALAGVAAGRRA